jgi:hypothetical protein
MIAAATQDRSSKAAEYLLLLRSMASELEKAMHAIAGNALPDLEESVANQQVLSARLTVLAGEISGPLATNSAPSAPPIDADLKRQILIANDALQTLNRSYAALLQHSSRSIALMVSLFSSFRGQFKEASGPRLKHQTWSCQV